MGGFDSVSTKLITRTLNIIEYFMQFFKKIFNIFNKNKEATELPAEIELIPNELWVQVTVHSIPIITQNSNANGLSFLTRGLESKGQQELFLVLKTNKITIQDVPQEPLFFFQQVYQLASQGLFAKEGSITQFGDKDLWGWKGVLYAKAPLHLQKTLPKNCLSMILLNLDELKAVQEYGFTRILCMLGKQARYFFFPYWVDDYRANLPIKEMNEKTFLHRSLRLALPEANITLINRQNLYLKVEKSVGTKFQMSDFNYNKTITILPSLAAEADSCLTWSFNDKNAPEAITLPNSTGKVMGACILILVPNQPKEECRIIEDGFLLTLREKTWTYFWQTFIQQKTLEIKLESDISSFSLFFV